MKTKTQPINLQSLGDRDYMFLITNNLKLVGCFQKKCQKDFYSKSTHRLSCLFLMCR